MKREFDLTLYLVTDSELAGDRDLVDIVVQAVKGGVTMVQIREKNSSTKEFIALAKRMKTALTPYNVALVANDRVDVVLAAELDGVHLGQSDMNVEDARKILGKDKIIGLSVENMQQVKDANDLDIDYIGISPLYATPTKQDTYEPFGLEGLAKASALSSHLNVVIGGLNLSTIEGAFQAGAGGVAVVSAIIASQNPYESAREMIEKIL